MECEWGAWDSGFRVPVLVFRASYFACRVLYFAFGDSSLSFRVSGSGLRFLCPANLEQTGHSQPNSGPALSHRQCKRLHLRIPVHLVIYATG